jgi:pimeloyl-ACP methyl ester carboxylesterase
MNGYAPREVRFKFAILPYILLLMATAGSSSDERIMNWQEEEIRFATGGFSLHGVLVKPQSRGPHPAVIFVHGDGPIDRTMLGYYIPIWKKFVEVGYACMSWDKPGVGKSTGTFGDETLFHDRASIAAEAVRCLKAREDINSKRIGYWGISQAGYIIPLVSSMTNDISFMVAISCPGTTSIDQGAYFIENQLISEGIDAQAARKTADCYLKSRYAQSYEEYFRYAELLGRHPYLKETGWAEVKSKDSYVPLQPKSESFFNPISVLEGIKFPVLAIFGEKDTQIPPSISAEAYIKALKKAGNEHYKVIMFPGADHVIFNTTTGSLREWEDKFRNQQMDYSPKYLDTMTEWLKELLQQ